MNIKDHIELNNDYQFRSCCAQKSIETFEFAIKNNLNPSRINLLVFLIRDTITFPLYLTKKSAELAVDIFRLINLKTDDKKNIKWFFTDLSGVIIFQLLTPVVCCAIRINASAIGLIFPSLALKGWKVAENGENLASILWTRIFKDLKCKSANKRVFKEINPSNAIYYLGTTFTQKALQTNPDEIYKLEMKIVAEFELLLLKMSSNPSCCLHILFDHDKALHPQTTLNKNGVTCLINYDIKKILFSLKAEIGNSMKGKKIIHLLKNNFTIDEFHKLFFYININLNNIFFENQEEFEKFELSDSISQLKDLFSQRFSFGRVNLPLSFYNTYSSSMQ